MLLVALASNKYTPTGPEVDERIQGFILTSYDPAGAAVFQFIDPKEYENTIYTVTSLTKEVQTVSIRLPEFDKRRVIALTLCEVEVYGGE